MEADFDQAIRTFWSVKSPVEFFRRLRSLFPQIEGREIEEIEDILENYPEYDFEIPFYDHNISETEPSIILVMETGQVMMDFLHPIVMRRQLNMIEYFLLPSDKIKNQRKITKDEWLQRAALLTSGSDDPTVFS